MSNDESSRPNDLVSIQKFRHELTITTHLVENGLRQQTHHQEMRREQEA
jgi:hypothetical protein